MCGGPPCGGPIRSPFSSRIAIEAASPIAPEADSTPSTRLDLVDQRLGQRRARLGQVEAGLDLLLGADRDVDALVRRREDVVERLVDRVAQHQRAGDHRDPEEDRDGGQRGAQLVRDQPAEGEPEHAGAQSSRIRAMTSSSPATTLSAAICAVGEDDDAVRVGGDARIVRDHDDGLVELVDRAAQDVEHAGARGRVEVAGRLVGEDDGGAGDERAGDRDALLLAAGELGGPVRGAVGEADHLEQLREPGLVDARRRRSGPAARCSRPRRAPGRG